MKCPLCKQGETSAGTSSVTLQRGGLTLVVKDVPAQVCDNCGEAYVDEQAAAQLLEEAAAEARAGTEINVRHFQVASLS